jgi:hypothetical protein
MTDWQSVGLAFLAPLAKFAPSAKGAAGNFRGVKVRIKRFAPVARAFSALPGAIQQFVPAARAFQQALPAAVQQVRSCRAGFPAGSACSGSTHCPAAQAFQQLCWTYSRTSRRRTEFASSLPHADGSCQAATTTRMDSTTLALRV